jgi:hypothetical protein
MFKSLMAILLVLSIPAFGQNPLDNLGLTSGTPAAAAYSLRKLSTSYTGNAIQVRRSSDTITQNIGFTASGDLDTTALKAFVGVGNNGFVTTWYDQSGNGRNAAQTTATLQPRIVSNGALITENGRPYIDFTGNKGLVISNYNALLAFTAAVLKSDTSVFSGFHTIFDGTDFGVNERDGGIVESNQTYFHDNVYPTAVWKNGTALANPFNLAPITTPFQLSIQNTGGLVSIGNIGNYDNGSLGGAAKQSETIVFSSVPSTTNRQTLERNQRQFYGISASSTNGTAEVSSYTCPGTPAGTMVAGMPVSGVSQTITANVTTTGTYNISATANGVTFAASGTFSDTGSQTITLTATGTPTDGGTHSFALNTAPTCSFTRSTNEGSSRGTAVVSGYNCTTASAGTMSAGALVSGVSQTITATVTKEGTYNISATANGVTFAGSGVFTVTGSQNITLTAAGTPTDGGTHSFALNTAPTCSFSRFTDIIPSTTSAAYSLRKLRTAYSGAAINVRSSGGATQDIGFTAAGDLDTIALKTFVGSGNGFVTTWYDQSGNGRNATQTTAANQPRIVMLVCLILPTANPLSDLTGQIRFSVVYPFHFLSLPWHLC